MQIWQCIDYLHQHLLIFQVCLSEYMAAAIPSSQSKKHGVLSVAWVHHEAAHGLYGHTFDATTVTS
jgi:hypothetical protein